MDTPYGYAKNPFLPVYTLWDIVMYFAKKTNSSPPLPAQVYTGQAEVRISLLATSCFPEGFPDRDSACLWISED